MTRVLLLLDTEHYCCLTHDDPRTMRELLMVINTCSAAVDVYNGAEGLTIGADGKIALSGGSDTRRARAGRLWAMGHPSVNVLTILPSAPPVRLGRRHFEILFAVADGLSAGQIALQLDLSPRTVYNEFAELKRRFGVESKEELLIRAARLGWV